MKQIQTIQTETKRFGIGLPLEEEEDEETMERESGSEGSLAMTEHIAAAAAEREERVRVARVLRLFAPHIPCSDGALCKDFVTRVHLV